MSILIVIYEFGILPFLMGLLWCQNGKKLGFCSIYVHGYMTMFALFFVIAVPFIHLGRSLSDLAAVWSVVAVLVPVCVTGKILASQKSVKTLTKAAAEGTPRNDFAAECRYLSSDLRFACRKLKGMMALTVVLAAVSVFLVTPSAQDDTPEVAGISVQTDTMYVYQPYTYIPYENNSEGANSPLVMLYAAAAWMSAMNATVLIHSMVPVFFILLYAAVGWYAADLFFSEEWQKKRWFTEFWLVTGTVAVGANRALSVGVYRNIWNGITLITACILPLIAVESIAAAEEFRKTHTIGLCRVLFLAAAVLAAQLAIKNGTLLAALIFMMCVCGALVREGIRYVGEH